MAQYAGLSYGAACTLRKGDWGDAAVVSSLLHRLAQGRTTVVITHRLSTIVEADQIVVLDHGKHQELLALGRRYAQIWAEHQ